MESTESMDDEAQIASGRRPGWIALIAGVAFFVAVSVTVGMQQVSIDGKRSDLTAEISEISSQLESTSQQVEQARADGYSQHFDSTSARHDRDVEILNDSVRYIGTWDSSAKYTNNRDELIELLGLEDDSPLVGPDGMMPTAPVRTDSSGATFSLIDVQGLNSRVSSVNVEPMGQAGDERTYLVTFGTTSTASSGDAVATGEMALTATLDADGKAVSIQGGPMAQEPVLSVDQ